MDCLFCKIAGHKIPQVTYEFEDDLVVAFKDIKPLAPVHILIIPKKHFADLNGLEEKDEALFGHIVKVASDLAQKNQISAGWQLFVRVGEKGGQEVGHVHFHLISGQLV